MARGPLAGAAGPGKFSKRTDLPSQYYGEGVETASVKSGAPLAQFHLHQSQNSLHLLHVLTNQ